MAEAKLTAQIDDEPFNYKLLSVPALTYYGGEADLAIVNDYVQNYEASKQEKNLNLNEYLLQAFNFVIDKENWNAISKLANYILTCNKNIISCEEIETVIARK